MATILVMIKYLESCFRQTTKLEKICLRSVRFPRFTRLVSNLETVADKEKESFQIKLAVVIR